MGAAASVEGESAAPAPESIDVFDGVSTERGNNMQKQIHDLEWKPNAAWTQDCPPVFISYATGTRTGKDDPGCGPGMELCHKIVMELHKKGYPCWTGLHAQAGDDWKDYFKKLKVGDCKVMIVLRTKKYYESGPCLNEIVAAQDSHEEHGTVILPLRCEHSGEKNTKDPDKYPYLDEPVSSEGWADKGDTKFEVDKDLLADGVDASERKAKARKFFGSLNSEPSRGVMKFDTKARGMGSLEELVNKVDTIMTPVMAVSEDAETWKICQSMEKGDDSMDADLRKDLKKAWNGFLADKRAQHQRILDLNEKEGKLGKDEAKFVCHRYEVEGFKCRFLGQRKVDAGQVDRKKQRQLNKDLYFASGRNYMPLRGGDVGLGALFPDVHLVLDLLEQGADPNAYGEVGCRALHFAVFKQCKECCHALIGAGANVNQLGLMANSGLMIMGNLPIKRRSPLDLAERPHGYGIFPKHQGVIDSLKMRGATLDGKELPDADDEEFDDPALQGFLKRHNLDPDGKVYEACAKAKMYYSLITATAGAGKDAVIKLIKERMEHAKDCTQLSDETEAKIGEKAADEAQEGPLHDAEFKKYGDLIDAMKGGMSKEGVAKKTLQVAMKAAKKTNSNTTGKVVRMGFKKAQDMGWIAAERAE